MDTLSIACAVSFNAAALILIAGVLWKMSIYARAPAPRLYRPAGDGDRAIYARAPAPLGPRLTGNRIDLIHARLPAPLKLPPPLICLTICARLPAPTTRGGGLF